MFKIRIRSLGAFAAILGLFFASCQKTPDVDLDNPPPIPEEVLDSTLLIKSIACILNNGSDSVVEHYDYDTINRKITVSWTFSDMDENDPNYVPEFVDAKTEFHYNNAGRLIRVDYTHSPHLPPSDDEYTKAEIIYDDENIVKRIILSYRNRPADVREFEKTMLDDGRYVLEWLEPAISSTSSDISRISFFSADGRVEMNLRISFILNEPFKYDNWLDTIYYDANGNVEKVFTQQYDAPGHVKDEYFSVEYTDRESGGDEFYNQRKLLLNGISEIPIGEYDEMLLGSMGMFSRYLEFEAAQFSRFPARKARIRLEDGSFQEYQPVYTFDSKNRLSLITCYFLQPDLHPVTYRIHYFN